MKIEFWSDYACPFCWIGEARLKKALRKLALESQADLIPHAFELDPHAPKIASVNA